MSEIKYLISDFLSFDNKKIFFHSWTSENGKINPAKSNLIIIHGYSEHGARYENFARFMCKNGFDVYAIDLRGHGISEGVRAHVNSFDEYFEDIRLFINIIKKKNKKNIFALGHSMGGLILTDYMVKLSNDTPIKAAVLTSPLFKLKMKVPIYAPILRLFKNFIPTLRVKNEIDPYALTHDREIASRYVNDTLVSKTTTVGWYFAMLDKKDEINSKFHMIAIPTHIFQGCDDQICDKNGATSLKNSLNSSLVEVTLLDNLYHEILNETNREETYKLIVKWFERF